MRSLARSSALALCGLCLGAGFFSNPARVAKLYSPWEVSEIGPVWSDNFNRASLGTNWINQGGANVTIVSNELVFNHSNVVLTRQVYYQPWLTASDQWKLQWTQRFESLNELSWGLGMGIKNFQAAGGDDRGYNGWLAGAGTNLGRMHLQRWDGTGTEVLLSTGPAMALAAGDLVDCTLIRSGWTLTTTASNRANGQSSSATINFSMNLATPTISRICFYPFGGTIHVDDVSFTINHRKPARVIVLGASTSESYNASDYSKGYVQVVQSNYTQAICNDSAAYNSTSNAVSLLPETFAHHPETALLMIGGNDLFYGYPPAQWKAQYSNLVAQLKLNGVKVKHCLPAPRNSVDLTALKTWILTNYPASEIIDTWTPFLLPPHSLLPAYDSGDGVHPNDAGHLLLGQIIRTNL
jgi:lysophospholipase L1-like esterase